VDSAAFGETISGFMKEPNSTFRECQVELGNELLLVSWLDFRNPPIASVIGHVAVAITIFTCGLVGIKRANELKSINRIADDDKIFVVHTRPLTHSTRRPIANATESIRAVSPAKSMADTKRYPNGHSIRADHIPVGAWLMVARAAVMIAPDSKGDRALSNQHGWQQYP
jgi:hypothetical protein